MEFEHLLLLKMGQPRPLFVYFWSFQTNNTILTTIRPLDRESPPITTTPD